MRPGATSAVLRWRVGSWLVGTALILFVLDVLFWGQGFGFWCLCLFMLVIGALVANPFRMLGRLRDGMPPDPVVRLRPLGIFGFIIMMVLFLVPFAIGEWLLNLVGELRERRGSHPVSEDAPLPVDEETLAGHPPVPWPGAEGFEDIFYDEDDPYRVRRWRPTRPFSRR